MYTRKAFPQLNPSPGPPVFFEAVSVAQDGLERLIFLGPFPQCQDEGYVSSTSFLQTMDRTLVSGTRLPYGYEGGK